MNHGADVTSRGHHGQTALYVASSRGNIEFVQLLLDHGADLNVVCNDEDSLANVKRTPLHVASRNGSLETTRVLLEHGANVNYKVNHRKSALHLALHHPSFDLSQLLLVHGASPNLSSNHGNTWLHEASTHGLTTVLVLLLEYGVNAQKDCLTALHLGALNGHTQVEVLLGHGADLYARTGVGKTPFQLASDWNHTQIVRLLSKRTSKKTRRLRSGDGPSRS